RHSELGINKNLTGTDRGPARLLARGVLHGYDRMCDRHRDRKKATMNIAITGASGFIGRALAERLRTTGHTVTPVSLRSAPPAETFAACDAVMNLAGELVAQRWTSVVRERIRNS